MCQNCLGEKIVSKCCGGPLINSKCTICGRFASKVECKNCNTSTLSKIPNYSFLLYQYFRDVTFNDTDHSYWYKGKKLTSATTKKAEIKGDFHREYWLKYKTLEATEGVDIVPNGYPYFRINGVRKHYKNINVDTSELEAEWEKKKEDGLRKGTAIHKYLENAWNRKYYTRRSELLDSYIEDHAHYIPISLEQIVSDFKYHGGQVDGIFYDIITDEIVMADYKTDKELLTKSKYRNKLKYPFEDLDDCNYNGYRIQMNMYRYMLEPIIPIHKMEIVHFTDTAYDKYDIKFLDVSKLMNNDYKRRTFNTKELP